MTARRARLKLNVEGNGQPAAAELDGVPVVGLVSVMVTQRVHEPLYAVLTVMVDGVEFEGPATVDLREEPRS